MKSDNHIVSCPHCKSKLAVPSSALGKKVRCTNCQKVLKLALPEKNADIPSKSTQPTSSSQKSSGTDHTTKLPSAKATKPVRKQATKSRLNVSTRKTDKEILAELQKEEQDAQELAKQRQEEVAALRNQHTTGTITTSVSTEKTTELLSPKIVAILALLVFTASAINYLYINPVVSTFITQDHSEGPAPDPPLPTVSPGPTKKTTQPPSRIHLPPAEEKLRVAKLKANAQLSTTQAQLNLDDGLITVDYDFTKSREKTSWEPSSQTRTLPDGTIRLLGKNNQGAFVFKSPFHPPFVVELTLKTKHQNTPITSILTGNLTNPRKPHTLVGPVIDITLKNKPVSSGREKPSPNFQLYTSAPDMHFGRTERKFFISRKRFPIAEYTRFGYPLGKSTKIVIQAGEDTLPRVAINSHLVKWEQSKKGKMDSSSLLNKADLIVRGKIPRPKDAEMSDTLKELIEKAQKKIDKGESPSPFELTRAYVVIRFSNVECLDIERMRLKAKISSLDQ